MCPLWARNAGRKRIYYLCFFLEARAASSTVSITGRELSAEKAYGLDGFLACSRAHPAVLSLTTVYRPIQRHICICLCFSPTFPLRPGGLFSPRAPLASLGRSHRFYPVQCLLTY
ncbi:hypothetical protein C8Q72DRAFT_164284 [Fomitopsis betulina]|nr:hypothetical protein C8Q72DRAFT_164284 [Fomitopsis betulina]